MNEGVTGDEMRAILYEMRYDMLNDTIRDIDYEVKMRSDDDYFYTHLVDKFGDELTGLRAKIEAECNLYGQCPDYWSEFLIEK